MRQAINILFCLFITVESFAQTPTKSDNTPTLINSGIIYYKQGLFSQADSLFRIYCRDNPDSILGHLWRGRLLFLIDSNMKKGMAVSEFEELLRIAETNKTKFKNYGIEACVFLINYHTYIKKDNAAVIKYNSKKLEFEL